MSDHLARLSPARLLQKAIKLQEENIRLQHDVARVKSLYTAQRFVTASADAMVTNHQKTAANKQECISENSAESQRSCSDSEGMLRCQIMSLVRAIGERLKTIDSRSDSSTWDRHIRSKLRRMGMDLRNGTDLKHRSGAGNPPGIRELAGKNSAVLFGIRNVFLVRP